MAKSKDRIIDTAINEWRKQLKVRMREDGQYFEHLLWASRETEEVMDK